jgi:hypothetical protein
MRNRHGAESKSFLPNTTCRHHATLHAHQARWLIGKLRLDLAARLFLGVLLVFAAPLQLLSLREALPSVHRMPCYPITAELLKRA